jgi:hypothetical protein
MAGKPWDALQKQNDGGVVWQFTGYRHEVENLAKRLVSFRRSWRL